MPSIGPKYPPPRFLASKAAPKPKKGKGDNHLSETSLEEEGTYSYARDKEIILRAEANVYDGLRTFGEYAEDELARAIKMLKEKKEALDGKLSHHEYDEIKDSWISLCQRAIEYLEWANSCEIAHISREYVETNNLFKDFESRAVNTAYEASEANLLKKFVLKQKIKYLIRKSKKIKFRAVEIREGNDARLMLMRNNSPAAKAFHEQFAQFRANVKKQFPDIQNIDPVNTSVEQWARNMMFRRSYQEAGWKLSDM